MYTFRDKLVLLKAAASTSANGRRTRKSRKTSYGLTPTETAAATAAVLESKPWTLARGLHSNVQTAKWMASVAYSTISKLRGLT